MRVRRLLFALVGLVGMLGVASGLAAAAGVSWGSAIEVPGTAALNLGGSAAVNSVSCASTGNCAAGGYYVDGSNAYQAFVVDENNGVWGTAIEVPGTAALNAGHAEVTSVSCRGTGNCAAGGFYSDASNAEQAFVVDEKNGVWGTAVEVPGTAVLNSGGYAQLQSVSCAGAGNCAAGGRYSDGSHDPQAFVVSEKNGVWGTAVEVPGTAALNTAANAGVNSVSCASTGNCAAGGFYRNGFDAIQAFVVDEKNGVWGKAKEVPGTAALNVDGYAPVVSVSCASSGNCAAGGAYGVGGGYQAFVVSEKHGVWGKAKKVPGTAALNVGGNAAVFSVSCASAGNCAAGGYYKDGSNLYPSFVVDEKNGVWGTAKKVPGTAGFNDGAVESVSCASAGNCAAGGYYRDGSFHPHAFLVSEKNGVWGKAVDVPGTAALNTGGSDKVSSVSCVHAGKCAVGGSYSDGGRYQVFVTAP